MKVRLTVCCLLALVVVTSAMAESWFPERRRVQFQNDSGYVVFPYVFSLPGIGSGYGVLGAVNNIGGSYMDVGGTFFEGDVSGQALGVESIHLIPKTLILDLGGATISRIAVRSYRQRGMETEKDDYAEAELSDMVGCGTRLTATFLERRVEAYYGYYGSQARLSSLRDNQGGLIVEADGADPEWAETHVLGGRLDLTDDYLDPRRGVRFEPSVWWSPPKADAANFCFVDASVTAYLPAGKRSTWAFNYLRSDAYVLEQGETDPVRVAGQVGLGYGEAADVRERQYVDNIVAANRYGNATSLGGYSRLRSYPELRYNGAHTQFFGTEFRWNLTDEMKPFDLFFTKDVRTAVQVAPFYEIGTVVDNAGELWDSTRASYGIGVRVVTASGLIYRLDFSAGDEGVQPSIFFQYPWEL
jgi:outer membrane protein assembly factor BamA